jgi:anti-sigma factor RsiW
MTIDKMPKHPNDEQLLAYLDGELTKAKLRAIREHLKRCWKCRTLQADLEAHVEFISRMLSPHRGVDSDRSARAEKHFLERKKAFEKRNDSLRRLWHARPISRVFELIDCRGRTELVLAVSM